MISGFLAFVKDVIDFYRHFDDVDIAFLEDEGRYGLPDSFS